MAQLRQDYAEFSALNTEIVVVGPEEAAAFVREWEREHYPFVGIPDPEHRIADLYEQEVKLLKLGRMPALVLIDREGAIIYRHYGSGMQDIPDNAELLHVLKNAQDPGLQ